MISNPAVNILLLALSLILFYSFPSRFRIYTLTIFSLVFLLISSINGVLVLLGSFFINYTLVKWLHLSEGRKRNTIFIFAILINLLGLFAHKYIEPGGILFQFIFFTPDPSWITLGFSFYTLQNIALLSDVNNRINTPPGFFNHLFYLSFFPKIQSGPIELPGNLIKNLAEIKNFLPENLISGLFRIVTGLFKKTVLADGLTQSVSAVFENDQQLNGLTVISGLYLFTIQLYFDFSGYTDIALGTARLFGYTLPENFNRPFLSLSVTEFWRRWHISLIQWLTRYVYYPVSLGLRNYGKTAVAAGIAATFLFSSLWHGSGITFLTWAGIHFLYLITEYLTASFRKKWIAKKSRIKNILCIVFVFNLVAFSNLFFRAGSMDAAEKIFSELLNFSFCLPCDFHTGFLHILAGGGDQLTLFNFLMTLLFVALFFILESRLSGFQENINYSLPVICLLLLLIFMFGELDDSGKFIYRQF